MLLKALSYIVKMSVISVCVFIMTLPVIMIYFGEVSLATFLSNLFMGVICEAFMVLSIVALALSNVFVIGRVLISLATVLGGTMSMIVERIASVERIMLSLAYPNTEIFVFGLFILFVLLFCIKLKNKWLIVLPSVLFVILFSVNVFVYTTQMGDAVSVEYSRGDAVVISSSDKVYICDASNGRYGSLYEGVLLAKGNCFTEIDGIVLTHYHSYHRATLNRLADTFVVRSVYLPRPQNEQESMVMSSIVLALEDSETKVYMYDGASALNILGGELTISERAYSNDYAHPSVALSYKFGESRIFLLENPYFDTYLEDGRVFDKYLRESDIVIFGSDGRLPEERFEVFYKLKQGAEVIFANRENMLLSDFEPYVEVFDTYVDVGYKKYYLK